MKLLDKLGGGVGKVFAAISGVSLLAMFLVLFVQVLLRYFFRIGIIWTDEFSRYLMLWIIMLGASVMTFDDSHIRISLLEDVAPVLKKGFKVIRYLIICVFSAILIYYSMDMVKMNFSSLSSNMRIPMAYVYLCFPISAVSMLFFALLQLIKTVSTLFHRGEAEDKEAEE